MLINRAMVNDIKPDAAELARRITGVVLLPGEPGYAEECATYNPAVPNDPALVVGAADPSDVQAAVVFAQDHDLAVAVLNTGHTTVVTGPRTLLITTGRMTGVTIGPEARRARVGPGCAGSRSSTRPPGTGWPR